MNSERTGEAAALLPFFGEGFEAGLGEVFGEHEGVDFDVGVEGEEPGFGEGGDAGGVGEVEDEEGGAFAGSIR